MQSRTLDPMLAAKKIPEVLRTILDTGIDGVCLMTLDGSLLSSVHATSDMSENTFGAISSSVLSNYMQGETDF